MAWRDLFVEARIVGPSIVTIGTFDGVHVGHQHLLNCNARRARELGATSIAITFHPRPAEVLRPDKPSTYLCSLDERCRRLQSAGAARILVVPFSTELASVSAEEFVTILVQDLNMRVLVGGPDVALGRGREGTPSFLRPIGERLGFSLEIAEGMTVSDQVVRTSVIRQALAEGDLPRATALLGRPYRVDGIVVRGDGRGRTIGVPTANVSSPDNIVLPGHGVYAVRFTTNDQTWGGAANLGVRPTFAGVNRSLEVHLLDYSGDLYDQRCSVEFVTRLRSERRFAGVEGLVNQIQTDIADARQALGPSAPL